MEKIKLAALIILLAINAWLGASTGDAVSTLLFGAAALVMLAAAVIPRGAAEQVN